MRINARLDESRSRKLEFLSRATDLSTSDIVKQAIDVYYDQVRGQRPRPAEVLSNSGFIGCGEASSDLSERYKETVRDFVHGWFDGIEQIKTDPTGSYNIVGKALKLDTEFKKKGHARRSIRNEYTANACSDPVLSESWAWIKAYLNDATCPI